MELFGYVPNARFLIGARSSQEKAYLSVWLCKVRIALCPVLPKMRGIYNIPLALKYHPFFLLFHAWRFLLSLFTILFSSY
jgi:hypothetical protein